MNSTDALTETVDYLRRELLRERVRREKLQRDTEQQRAETVSAFRCFFFKRLLFFLAQGNIFEFFVCTSKSALSHCVQIFVCRLEGIKTQTKRKS